MTLPSLSLPKHVGRLSGSMLHDAMENGDGFAIFDCDGEETLLAAAEEYGVILPHRDADARGITYLRDIPGLGVERGVGFTRETLLPHTDRPAAKQPPRVLLLWCRGASSEGGEATVLRCADVAARLNEIDPKAFQALCEDDAAIFRTGTDELVSPIFRMHDGVVTEVRLRFDPYVYFAPNAARALPALDRAFADTELAFPLEPGKGYALRNDLWFHGRRSYSGGREMLRIMVGAKSSAS
jgi:hypothetical protein